MLFWLPCRSGMSRANEDGLGRGWNMTFSPPVHHREAAKNIFYFDRFFFVNLTENKMTIILEIDHDFPITAVKFM